MAGGAVRGRGTALRAGVRPRFPRLVRHRLGQSLGGGESRLLQGESSFPACVGLLCTGRRAGLQVELLLQGEGFWPESALAATAEGSSLVLRRYRANGRGAEASGAACP